MKSRQKRYGWRNRATIGLVKIVAALAIMLVVVWNLPNEMPIPTFKPEPERKPIKTVKAPSQSVEEAVPVVSELLNESPADSDPVELTFGNGEWVEVTWRGLDWNEAPLAPYGHQYESLYERATYGDRDAAFTLFYVVDYCKNALGSKEELDSAIETARATMTVDVPHRDAPIEIHDLQTLERFERRMVSMYKNCEAITSEQAAEADKWLLEAANGGPTEALTYYASTLDDRAAATEYLERAWAMGSVSALDYLGQTYLSLYQSGAMPENDVKAYVAFYAYAILAEQGTIAHGNDATEVIQTHKKRLAEPAFLLSDREQEEAIDLAMDMIRSNSNCCYSN